VIEICRLVRVSEEREIRLAADAMLAERGAKRKNGLMAETERLQEDLGLQHGEIPGANVARTTELPASSRARWLAFAVVGLVVLLFAGIRWRVREMPLERDEGEYAYAGQLILQGIPPYQLAYNMKLPGTYVAYAAILRTFGETAAGIHVGLMVVNGLTTVMVFFLARRLYGDLAAATAAASFALLSTSEGVLGLAGHATHFVTFFAVAGLLFLVAARRSESLLNSESISTNPETRKTYFAAGVSMGLAFLMKQPGAIFILFGAQELVCSAWRDREERKKLPARLGVYGAGAVIPYLLTCAVLYRAGVFAKFYFWTVSYARQYATSTEVMQGLKYLREIAPDLFFGAPVAWCFAAAGLFALVRERGKSAALSFEVSLLGWSFVAASAGLYYRNHYFIVMLPAVCLLAGKAMAWSAAQLAERVRMNPLRLSAIGAAVFLLGYAQALYAQRAIFFEMSPEKIVRSEYGGNPFPEAIAFGKYIKEHSDADVRVAVLGSEPEIYFYAQRHSATGYIYTYGLMEEQKFASRMQQEMIGEIEKAKPEYVVKVMVPASWLRKTNSDTAILYWAEKYIRDDYRLVGVADIAMTTTYHWDDAAEGYRPLSKYSVYLYKRKI
jgi:4-amino-4-deoxy-L-arabinose transferase-like glycosyltransferase